jgi:hypothetical protein
MKGPKIVQQFITVCIEREVIEGFAHHARGHPVNIARNCSKFRHNLQWCDCGAPSEASVLDKVTTSKKIDVAFANKAGRYKLTEVNANAIICKNLTVADAIERAVCASCCNRSVGWRRKLNW